MSAPEEPKEKPVEKPVERKKPKLQPLGIEKLKMSDRLQSEEVQSPMKIKKT